jgi:hypothetical protein
MLSGGTLMNAYPGVGSVSGFDSASDDDLTPPEVVLTTVDPYAASAAQAPPAPPAQAPLAPQVPLAQPVPLAPQAPVAPPAAEAPEPVTIVLTPVPAAVAPVGFEEATYDEADEDRGTAAKLLVPLIAGALVTVTLGVYGSLHEPTGIAVSVAGFSGPQTVKVWLATGAAFFAVIQLVSALAMYGKLGFAAPGWVGPVHRWSGRTAFLLAVPVAVHCLYALGLQSTDTRVLIHSLLGCLFFGAFTTKMFVLPKHGLPGWVLPLFGGVVFAGLIGLWLSSSVWFFTTFGVKF